MALEDTIAILSRTPLIGHLGVEALRLLAFTADIRRLRPGEVLYRQGDRSDGGYIVIEGELVATREGTDVEAIAGEGDLVGQNALFVRSLRPATVAARTRSSVLRISPTLMRRIVDEFPSSSAAIQAAMESDLVELVEGLDRVRDKLVANGKGQA